MTAEPKFADIVRSGLEDAGNIREVRMFGGIGFMLNGLVAGISKRGLLLRVGQDQQARALAQAGTRPMVTRGHTMQGYIYVDAPALTAKAIRSGLRLAIAHVQTLPSKRKTPRA